MLALQSQVRGGAKAQPQIDIIASEARLCGQQARQYANITSEVRTQPCDMITR